MLLSRQRANEKSPGGSEGDFELDLYVLECEEVASDFRITISAGMCAGGGNQAAGVCVWSSAHVFCRRKREAALSF